MTNNGEQAASGEMNDGGGAWFRFGGGGWRRRVHDDTSRFYRYGGPTCKNLNPARNSGKYHTPSPLNI
jgi:hypothetical protein